MATCPAMTHPQLISSAQLPTPLCPSLTPPATHQQLEELAAAEECDGERRAVDADEHPEAQVPRRPQRRHVQVHGPRDAPHALRVELPTTTHRHTGEEAVGEAIKHIIIISRSTSGRGTPATSSVTGPNLTSQVHQPPPYHQCRSITMVHNLLFNPILLTSIARVMISLHGTQGAALPEGGRRHLAEFPSPYYELSWCPDTTQGGYSPACTPGRGPGARTTAYPGRGKSRMHHPGTAPSSRLGPPQPPTRTSRQSVMMTCQRINIINRRRRQWKR